MLLFCNLRLEHDLKQEVSEFFLYFSGVVLFNRLNELIGFFDNVWFQRFSGLLLIPRASSLASELLHDIQEFLKVHFSAEIENNLSFVHIDSVNPHPDRAADSKRAFCISPDELYSLFIVMIEVVSHM